MYLVQFKEWLLPDPKLMGSNLVASIIFTSYSAKGNFGLHEKTKIESQRASDFLRYYNYSKRDR